MSSSSMASPSASHSANPNGGAGAGAGPGGQSDLFPLDFLSFSNFDTNSTSPQTGTDKGGHDLQSIGMGMDFDFSQFQSIDPPNSNTHHHGHGHSGGGSGSRRGSFAGPGGKRGSVSSVGTAAGGGGGGGARPTTSAGMEVDLPNGHGSHGSVNEFQMMLDAATAAAASASGSGDVGNGEASASTSTSFDQAGLLQQQLEHIHMQSPLVFGSMNGNLGVPAGFSQSQGQGQSPYNALAQYLTSPMAQTQTITEQPSSNNGNQEGSDAEKRKWMLATGLGGLFTPGPSGEMIPQVRPEHMSPMQLEMLAREGFESDFASTIPLLSPALSHQQNNSAYASPMVSANFASGNSHQIPFNAQQLPPSPLEALQIQQRHFQEQLALLQHQQRQLQATAEAVAAASSSPYVAAVPGSGSAPASRPATTPGVSGSQGAHSSNASPAYFSPLTSPALEASHHRTQYSRHQNQNQGQHFSPGFDPRGNKRTPHPLSALSSPALNPIGSSGGAQQTLSPALAPQNNNDMSDPEYIRALSGMLDGSGNFAGNGLQAPFRSGQSQPQRSNSGKQGSDGSVSAYPSPINLQAIDTAALSSPMVGPLSASSSSGPGPNRHSLPARTRPSPMIKPTPAQRGHHSRNGSTHQSPIVMTNQQQQRYAPTVPQPNYLPPAAIDQRGVQAHYHQQQQQQMALSTTSETPSPVDLSAIMPPPPVPHTNQAKAVTPMTPATLMNLGAGRDSSQAQGQSQGQAGDATPRVEDRQQQQTAPKRQASGRVARKASTSGTSTPTLSASTGSGNGAAGAAGGSGKKVKIAPAGKRALAARPPGVGVRAATKGAAAAAALAALPEGETRKTSHKAAEQKRRDSLKAGFDELRLLLPPINTEALDPESGEPIPGSSAPRLLPKSSLVPDDNPNRGVSKVALLKFSNEYIERLHEKVDKRDDYIDRLRSEVARLRLGGGDEVRGGEGEDLLEMNMLDGEEEYDGEDGEEDEEEEEEGDDQEGGDIEIDDLDLDQDQGVAEEDEVGQMELDLVNGQGEEEYTDSKAKRRSKTLAQPGSTTQSPALKPTKRPSVSRGLSNGGGRGRKVEA